MDHWQALVADVAVVSLFISTWIHGHFVIAGWARWQRDLAFGAMMGLGAVASMALSVQIQPGVLVDRRLSLVTRASFFGGPVAAVAAGAIAIGYRLMVGGYGAIPGSLSILVAVLVGFAVSRITGRRIPAVARVIVLAVTLALASLSTSVAFRLDTSVTAFDLIVLVAGLNAVSAALSAFFIMRYRVVERERDLLRAAFLQSPDFQYVKTPDSRFAAVNLNTAQHNGFAGPAQMLGKTDIDIAGGERGARLVADEQEAVATGTAIRDREEMLVGNDGQKVWYLTSKVQLRDRDGRIIGLAGVTRDVTVRRRLRDEAEESRNRLNAVLAGVSDGIAMFDRYGVLVYCNDQYRQIFRLTSDVRQPGAHIHSILRAVADRGEQKGVPVGLEDEWVEQVAMTLDEPGEQEIELNDGRWLHIRTRPTDDGTAMVVVSDVTTIKRAESALLTMTEQLKRLATTDGLTGLTNRRAMDQALETEVERARRARLPLSVLMVDVDHFKAYNDFHGHQAGDDVLKAVGSCLKGMVRRPGDVAARYGGEEFVIILPNTDEDGAHFIAEGFREALHSLDLPHQASDRRMVTASVGVATFRPGEAGVDAAGLLKRADEALYDAKAAGRDCVMGWQARRTLRKVKG
jgi:diguanylate cyclase (GGDEF)-like protein/PAS domain S-box-containing protein